jgi:hypothetical protein
MLFVVAAGLMFGLGVGDDVDVLPVQLSLDEPQQEEQLPERPSNLDAARPHRDEPEAWTVRLAPTFRYLLGKTRVREKASRPSWLDTREDLGIASSPGVHLDLVVDSGGLRWFLGADYSHTQGRGDFEHDFAYDEGDFTGNIPYHAWADMLFVRAGMVLPGAIVDRPGLRISPLIGLEYALLDVGIRQPATGAASAEQYKQFMPYPIAGVEIELRLSRSWTVTGHLRGGGLPEVPTFFLEGGRLSMRALSLSAGAEVCWHASDTLRLFAGVGYEYWVGKLKSIEDGNDFKFQAPVFMIGLEIAW